MIGRLGVPAAPLANASLRARPLRVAAEKLLGIHRDARDAGLRAPHRFRSWAKRHKSPAAPRRAVYFHGCGTDYYEPDAGRKTVAVLEHNGFQVDIPKQDCCGLPLQSNGLFDDARSYVLSSHARSRRTRATAP